MCARQIENEGRVISGIAFKALGLKPATPAPAPLAGTHTRTTDDR
jgi:hypothetical protein